MTSGATSHLRLGFIMADLILQKRVKVGDNLHFEVKVRQDLCSKVGFHFEISVAFSRLPQHFPSCISTQPKPL
jgi:hypothetical protein